MKNILSDMTEYDLQRWYANYLKNEVKKIGYKDNQHGAQSLKRHDLWSVYDYGDIVKVVYIKSLADIKKPVRGENKPANDTKKSYNLEYLPEAEKIKTLKPDDERFTQSISRTKSRIFELAMCNEFKYFCTFTQDEKKRDRFNLAEFRKDFAMLVRNLNRSRAESDKIKYLLIPEEHKNGGWHMHGLFMGLKEDDLRKFDLSEKIPERIKIQLRKGVAVYDWTNYRKAFGYFTCTEIKDNTACSKYITKYISKDLKKTARESGEHLFFASQGLKGRETVIKYCTEKCPLEKWDFENDYIKIAEIAKSR